MTGIKLGTLVRGYSTSAPERPGRVVGFTKVGWPLIDTWSEGDRVWRNHFIIHADNWPIFVTNEGADEYLRWIDSVSSVYGSARPA